MRRQVQAGPTPPCLSCFGEPKPVSPGARPWVPACTSPEPDQARLRWRGPRGGGYDAVCPGHPSGWLPRRGAAGRGTPAEEFLRAVRAAVEGLEGIGLALAEGDKAEG